MVIAMAGFNVRTLQGQALHFTMTYHRLKLLGSHSALCLFGLINLNTKRKSPHLRAFSQLQKTKPYSTRAFSSNCVTFHALVFDIGRVSSINTVSPVLNSLVSLCAWYFLERRTTLPNTGCITRRSTRTVTVLSILSLVMTPVSVRLVLLSIAAWVVAVIWRPSLSGSESF
jgi:hypothetical protein